MKSMLYNEILIPSSSLYTFGDIYAPKIGMISSNWKRSVSAKTTCGDDHVSIDNPNDAITDHDPMFATTSTLVGVSVDIHCSGLPLYTL